MTKQNLKQRRGNRRGGKSSNNRSEPVGTYMRDAWSLARRTAAGLNEIRKLINVEEKYIDNYSILTPTFTGLPVYINALAQGDDVTMREGDSIKVQTIEMSGFVQWNTGVNHNLARIMVFRDMANEGVLPAASDVLANAGGGSAVVCPYNFINYKEVNKRFSILYDELISVDAGTVAAPFRFQLPLNKHIYFRGASAVVTDAGFGSLFVLALSNQAAAGTAPTVNFATRVVFTDN